MRKSERPRARDFAEKRNPLEQSPGSQVVHEEALVLAAQEGPPAALEVSPAGPPAPGTPPVPRAPRVPSARVTKTAAKEYRLEVDVGDRAGNRLATGSDRDAFTIGLVGATLEGAVGRTDLRDDNVNGILAAMAELAPKDPVEGLLVSQAVALHFLGLRLAGQTGDPSQLHLQTVRAAVNALRASGEALAKLDARRRGPSVQKIQVERLTLEGNAQAVIGSAQVGGGGGGSRETH